MINTTKTEYLNFLTNLQKNFGDKYEISTEKIFNRISILIDNPKTHRPIGFYKLLKIDENTYDLLGFKPFKKPNWQHNNETLKLRTLVKTQRPFLLPTILYNSRRKRRKEPCQNTINWLKKLPHYSLESRLLPHQSSRQQQLTRTHPCVT